MLTALVVSFAPMVSTSTCHETSPGIGGGCVNGSESLVAQEGAGFLAIAMIPVAIAAVPVLRRSKGTALGAAVVLTVLVFGAGSVGLLLIPTAMVAWVAYVAARS